MKLLILIVLFFLCFNMVSSFPLVAQTKLFCDEMGSVTSEQTANYYRLANENFDKIYFLNGNIYQEVAFTKEKQVVTFRYHLNKKIASKSYFDKLKKEYVYEEWYANGQKKSESYETKLEGVKLLSFWDSLGVQTIKYGNGLFVDYFPNQQIAEKGMYLEGFKNDIWEGWFEDGKTKYQEKWQKGKILEGVAFSLDGEKITYTEFEIKAEAPSGMEHFYQFITKNIEYPKTARRNKTQGSVLMSVIVDKQGNITNIRVVKGIGDGCDEECIRILNASPKWKPAYKQGQPVKTKLFVPIIFKLN